MVPPVPRVGAAPAQTDQAETPFNPIRSAYALPTLSVESNPEYQGTERQTACQISLFAVSKQAINSQS